MKTMIQIEGVNRYIIAGLCCLAVSFLPRLSMAQPVNQGLTPQEETEARTRRLEFYAARLSQAAPEIREKIEKLQAEAGQKSWTFTVGYTHASDIPLDVLAGTRVPSNFLEAAKKQNEFANEAMK